MNKNLCVCGNPLCDGNHINFKQPPDPRIVAGEAMVQQAQAALSDPNLGADEKARALNNLIQTYMSVADVAIERGQQIIARKDVEELKGMYVTKDGIEKR